MKPAREANGRFARKPGKRIREISNVEMVRRPPTTGSSILDEAREIVFGDREQTHGEPAKNLRAIGHIWTAILAGKLQPDATIEPEIVCLMMAGLKLARAANRPSHREHALDTVGYMALMERCGFLADWTNP